MKPLKDVDSAERTMVVRIAVLLAGPLLYLLLDAQSPMLPYRVGWLVVPDVLLTSLALG